MSMVDFAALVDHPHNHPVRHGSYSLPWSRSACSGHGDPMQHPPDHRDSICRKVLQSKGVHLRSVARESPASRCAHQRRWAHRDPEAF